MNIKTNAVPHGTPTTSHKPATTSPLPMNDRWLSATEVALKLGISRTTVYRWLNADELPKPTRMSRTVRWSENEIDSWCTASKDQV